MCYAVFFFFFFFQAEDGIRDRNVTGVQTCALPISLNVLKTKLLAIKDKLNNLLKKSEDAKIIKDGIKIGRASCRERV